MILLDNVIQLFALPDCYSFVFIFIVLFDGCGVGAALVDIDQAGHATRTNRFVEKTPGCLRITLRSEQEINSLALLVDGAIKVFPLTVYFDVSLIEAPTKASPFLVFAQGLLDTRCVMHNPALNGTVVRRVAPLLHQFFQVAIAQRIGHVPTHTL